MSRFMWPLLLLTLVAQWACAAESPPIDREVLDRWSAPYRGWHYWPEPVIPAQPKIPGYEAFRNTDGPCVFQLPGQPNQWYMSFIAFNGQGYNSFVAESDDLIHWKNPRLAMGFGKPGEFDHGGCVIGAFLYDSYDIRAPRMLKRRDGKFWTLYGCYPRQGGYELRPGYEGVATSNDGLVWRRAKNRPILSVSDADCGTWEKSCIYQPWLVEHDGRFYDFYNAAQGGMEQTGLASSGDLLGWNRYSGNPVIRNRPKGYDEQFASDPKVFRDGDHWVMFYFGVGRGGAHIMAAFSRDLLHWTSHPEPLYKAGGHPGGLDKTYAHKISLVYRPENDTFYMYYCAVGNQGRCIGLITSKRLSSAVGPPGENQQPGLVTSELFFQQAPFRQCHASTIAETDSGLVAAWFGGTKEGARDVGIWLSRHEGGRWSAPAEVANGVLSEQERYACWNPVLFQPKIGPLMLFYKTSSGKRGPGPSHWLGMLVTSPDGGRTWSQPNHLPDGVIGPVKNKPLELPSGDLLCPSSTEDDGWKVRFERTSDLGKTWQVIGPVNDGRQIADIQPSLLVHPGGRLQAVGRTRQGRIFEIWSDDGGKTWGKMTLTDLPNPNSGIDALTLADGRHLLVYNHTGLILGAFGGQRSPLNVAVSGDGRQWQAALVLESGPGEFSYPAVIQTRDGLVHVTYTWKRQSIKHVVIDPARLVLRPLAGGQWPKLEHGQGGAVQP